MMINLYEWKIANFYPSPIELNPPTTGLVNRNWHSCLCHRHLSLCQFWWKSLQWGGGGWLNNTWLLFSRSLSHKCRADAKQSTFRRYAVINVVIFCCFRCVIAPLTDVIKIHFLRLFMIMFIQVVSVGVTSNFCSPYKKEQSTRVKWTCTPVASTGPIL